MTGATIDQPSAARRWEAPLALALVGALGLWCAHNPMLRSAFAQIQWNVGDTRLVNYILEHSWQWLIGTPAHASYWDAPMFYPVKNVSAWTEVCLGAAPVYWVFRALGAQDDTAMQWWMLAVSLLNFLAAALWLGKMFAARPWAAAVGAYFFAFGSPRVNQIGHQQLLPHFWTPLAFYALLRALEEDPPGESRWLPKRGWWLTAAAVCVALQLYAGFYLGWFLALVATLALPMSLVSKQLRANLWRLLSRRTVGALVGAALSGALLWPMMKHYSQAGKELGMRSLDETLMMVPRITSWLYYGADNWTWGKWLPDRLLELPLEHEHRIGLGVVTLLLTVVGWWLGRKRPMVVLAAVVALDLTALAMMYGATLTPWRFVYQYFPAGQAIRSVSRIAIMAQIPVAMSLTLVMNEVLTWPRRWVASAVVLFAMIEQGQTSPSYDKLRSRAHVEAIVSAVKAREGCEAFFFSPLLGPDKEYGYQTDALLAQARLGMPTVNGYSGHLPPGWFLVDPNIRSPDEEARIGWMLGQWAGGWHLDPRRICWVKVPLSDSDEGTVTEFTAPKTLQPGERATVVVRIKNNSKDTWTQQAKYRLGTQAPQDSTAWGATRTELTTPEVKPGEEARFEFPIVAPQQPGTYALGFRMVQEAVRWFGPFTPVENVTVAAAPAP